MMPAMVELTLCAFVADWSAFQKEPGNDWRDGNCTLSCISHTGLNHRAGM